MPFAAEGVMPQSMHGSRSFLALSLILSMSCGEQVVVRETRAACGNELIEVDEQCDDGNNVDTDACLNR
jgi:cysteine-rich repeat protein